MKKRVLMSVYDKTGLVKFAKSLVKLDWEIIASGGTAGLLSKNNIPVISVSEVTNSQEMLEGRVKTLHPAIHGGILARGTKKDRSELVSHNIHLIDMVVCNLYPFESTIDKLNITLNEAIEEIDIGGVTLLRAAAKNFRRVTIVSDPGDYDAVLLALRKNKRTSIAFRQELAVKSFARTRDYDTAITTYLEPKDTTDKLAESIHFSLQKVKTLRYGENPHQQGALYSSKKSNSQQTHQLLQGKELSYNNLLDLDLAWRAVMPYTEAAVVIVKHVCPCGVATGKSLQDAFSKALASDPVSAFGSVIAVNRPVGMQFAESLQKAQLFVECIIAPRFTSDALKWFGKKKRNCRLINIQNGKNNPHQGKGPSGFELRSIIGGYLVQSLDHGDPVGTKWKVVSKRKPTGQERKALAFAWTSVQYVKSNAIVFANVDSTVGIGGGLTSRVDAVRLAAAKSGEKAQGAAMASDAFFPFADGIEEAAKAGISAVIQPGGSVRDTIVIAAVNKLNIAMVTTGVRHFRH